MCINTEGQVSMHGAEFFFGDTRWQDKGQWAQEVEHKKKLLPREVEESSSVGIFKTSLDTLLCNLNCRDPTSAEELV